MKTEKERRHSYEIVFNAVKSDVRKILHFIDLSQIVQYEIMPPPLPSIKIIYHVDKEAWDFLCKLDNSKHPVTLSNALEKIAEQLLKHHAIAWKQRGKNINIKTISTNTEYHLSKAVSINTITVTSKMPTQYEESELINDVIKKFIKDKYSLTVKFKKPVHELTERQKEPIKKWNIYRNEILKELQTNRFIGFINFGNAQLLKPLTNIENIKSYLARRVKKEPKLIECKHCKRRVYVLHPNQEFCFNPSCRILFCRKKLKR